MLGVVVSRADAASTHIGEHLLSLQEWETSVDAARPDAEGGGTVYRAHGVELREFEALHLDIEDAAAAFDDPDLLVFASKHAGETEELLTAHHTGNFGVAEYGGEDGHFARACPGAHEAVAAALQRHAPPEYEVGMECTHHGPTDVGVPSMFVEVGSAEPQWDDPDAAEAAAKAILDLADEPADKPRENGTRRQLLGVGGGHYAPRFERVVRETDWAVGHIAANWSLDALSEWADSAAERDAVLERALRASAADYALMEGDRPDLEAAIESLGCRVVSETFVRETDGVDLGLVEALEAAVGPVEEGLRFGALAPGFDGEWTVFDLPDELISDARGVDSEALREAIEAHSVAYGTEQNGTVLTGPIVCPATIDVEAVVDPLVGILERRFDSVEWTAGELVARETAFDPNLARTAGVPEGPKFGKLASGQSVELDGEEIDPERFQRERIRRYTL
ncbi:D-aminoacyl-tRNA deacylase [Haloarcula brevis]|uniref:D-aminoacyl-tRNA deacylase n=1 Tax=Haloarcula brevis TaxID=3111453 RepID=UPI00300EAB03